MRILISVFGAVLKAEHETNTGMIRTVGLCNILVQNLKRTNSLEGLDVDLKIYLSICSSTALVDIFCFFSFLIYTQSAGLLGRGSAGRKAGTYTQNNTNTE
jgi:hypothetical protein